MFTPIRKVHKLDVHGNLWQATVMGAAEVDLGLLWKEFTDRLQSQPTREMQSGEGIGSKLSKHGENILHEKEY